MFYTRLQQQNMLKNKKKKKQKPLTTLAAETRSNLTGSERVNEKMYCNEQKAEQTQTIRKMLYFVHVRGSRNLVCLVCVCFFLSDYGWLNGMLHTNTHTRSHIVIQEARILSKKSKIEIERGVASMLLINSLYNFSLRRAKTRFILSYHKSNLLHLYRLRYERCVFIVYIDSSTLVWSKPKAI